MFLLGFRAEEEMLSAHNVDAAGSFRSGGIYAALDELAEVAGAVACGFWLFALH
jgi:hypothetical protein